MNSAVGILVVIGEMRHGGAQRVVSRLTEEWVRQGHKVTVAVFDCREVAYAVGGTLHDLKTPATRNPLVRVWRPIQRVRRLAGLMGGGGFSHIISFMEDSNFPVILAGWRTGMLGRVTVSTHADPRYLAWFQRLLLRGLYQLPKRVVTVSADAQRILQSWGVAEVRLKFIPNPAPASPATPPPRPQFKAKYILAVGRLHKQKGFDLLLHAYTMLANMPAKTGNVAGRVLPDALPDLVILGEGDQRHPLTQLATSLGISQQVHLMGIVANPEDWYAHAECFVLSSRTEAMPNAILEAMRYGCVVVSFDSATGAEKIIKHRENGVLVRNGDVEGLTRAIAGVLGDAKLRQQLVAGGRKRAGDFAVGEIARLWLVP